VGLFVVKAFHSRNAVDQVVLTEGFDQKHPTFPISLVKKYIADTLLRDTTPEVPISPPFEMVTDRIPSEILHEKIVRNRISGCTLRGLRIYPLILTCCYPSQTLQMQIVSLCDAKG
jgi:hypothetical protein